jgi:hypothetical protein
MCRSNTEENISPLIGEGEENTHSGKLFFFFFKIRVDLFSSCKCRYKGGKRRARTDTVTFSKNSGATIPILLLLRLSKL